MTCNCDGYTFSVHSLSTERWNDVPGVYIFAYVTPGNTWQAVYIGETGSFQTRLPGHERLDEAILAGATNIHAMQLNVSRKDVEERLIQKYRPVLQR